MIWNSIKSMLKVFKNIFFFKIVKTNTKKGRLEKPKKEKLLLLIPENIGDRNLSACTNWIQKVFEELNISNVSFFYHYYWLSILNISFDEHNNFRYFHLTIIAELFRGRSLLRNLKSITSHLRFINKWLHYRRTPENVLIFSD